MMKVMLDTNALDYIFNNDLIEKINILVNERKLELYVTHIQLDEIEKILDINKKEKIKEIQFQIIETNGAVVGEEESNRGFVGSGIGFCRITDDAGQIKIKDLRTYGTTTHPLGNSADALIAITSENMSNLVTDDIKLLKKIKDSKINVKVIKNSDFHKKINMLIEK